MANIEVPGPEADWETAPEYHGGKRNPAFQESTWEVATGAYRVVAGLQPRLEPLAARLRLTVERTWEDLGYVHVAMFRIDRLHFALSQFEGGSPLYTAVWLDRSTIDIEAALDVLLRVLGIGREALAFVGTSDTGFQNLNGWTSQ
ncbi:MULTISPECIES: hypothetical protein [Streptomycetaceae]|uniref:hypothetical protein n=1 Tax=Streptomycetaceae TaxID=2062 RepID=UPI00093FB685|nr:hypothetical protein [Streptomyces sp. CB02056]OKH97509.1 hypothetical protein AMK13_37970 [Streptomyces sp. CB02056]